MKTTINNTVGVVTTRDGNGLEIEGRDHKEAPFDDLWDDLYAVIDEGTGPAALTYEGYRDTGFFMRFFRNNQNDSIFTRYQMSHMWDINTGVRPHMHYTPMGSGSGTIKFNYAYAWFNVGDQVPTASGWVSGSVTASLTPDDQYKSKVLHFGEIVPTTQYESSILVFKVERPGQTDASDTYDAAKDHGTASANVGILFFDLHYRKIKAGTVSEYPTSR